MTILKIRTTLILHKLHSADTSAFRWCAARKHRDQLAELSRVISRTGDGPWYAAAGLLFALFGGEAGWLFFLAGLLGYGLEVPLYVALKKRFRRQRPFVTLGSTPYLMPSDEFSFPSGHTLHAVAFSLVAMAHYPALAWLLVPFTASVAASRVVLGLHYPSDVLAATAIGSGLAGLSLWLVPGVTLFG